MSTPCHDKGRQWTDPRDYTEALAALDGCAACPVLLGCREWAAGQRWWYPTVIAGWQPQPSKVRKTYYWGEMPPWAGNQPEQLTLGETS